MVVKFDAILERIIEILKANPELAKKVNTFRFGELSKVGYRRTPTECHVYTPNTMLTTAEQYGRSADTDEQYTIYVDIKINGFAKEPAAAKKDMVQNVELVATSLKKNTTLKKPSNGTDPLAARLVILTMTELAQFRGKLAPITIVHLKIQVGSEITMTIDTVGKDIPVLFAPAGQDMVEYGSIPSTFGRLDGYAAISNTRIRYYDLENTRDILDPLNILRDGQDKMSYTIKESGKKTTYSGYISTISPGQAYDGTPMVTLKLYVL